MNREARKLPRNLSRGKRITSTELIRHFEELFSDLESEGREREREKKEREKERERESRMELERLIHVNWLIS